MSTILPFLFTALLIVSCVQWLSLIEGEHLICRTYNQACAEDSVFFFGQTEDSALSFRFCRMIGSDESSTNYPGKIPHGLDLPSDVADEKHAAGNGPAK